jgi:putative endonuclease
VYIIETEAGKLYTGIAKNAHERFYQHLFDQKKQAKFFRLEIPLRICYLENVSSRSLALKREYQIKKMDTKKKWLLINIEKQEHEF